MFDRIGFLNLLLTFILDFCFMPPFKMASLPHLVTVVRHLEDWVLNHWSICIRKFARPVVFETCGVVHNYSKTRFDIPESKIIQDHVLFKENRNSYT